MEQIALIVISLWLLIMTWFVVRQIMHYNRLVRGTKQETLKDILETLLKKQDTLDHTNQQLLKKVELLEYLDTTHLQRVGIVRFNPFSDTGGSQSFTMALLDGKENGVVITSLYARTGNRWYIKAVKSGRGTEVELSKEENVAIKKAKIVQELQPES